MCARLNRTRDTSNARDQACGGTRVASHRAYTPYSLGYYVTQLILITRAFRARLASGPLQGAYDMIGTKGLWPIGP